MHDVVEAALGHIIKSRYPRAKTVVEINLTHTHIVAYKDKQIMDFVLRNLDFANTVNKHS